MNRNKNKNRKLAVRTETLRRLQPVADSDLARVGGGADDTCYCAVDRGNGARRTAMCNSSPTEGK